MFTDLSQLLLFCMLLQEVLQQLLDYQAKVDDLFTKSADVVPLYLRKYPSDDPIKIVALTSYKQSDVCVLIAFYNFFIIQFTQFLVIKFTRLNREFFFINICVCVCVCMCVCMCACMYVCSFSLSLSLSVCLHVCKLCMYFIHASPVLS